MLARLLTLPSTWWSRVTRARGRAKVAWGCLPVVVLLTCCVMGTAAGQSVGLIDVPPTRTPGPTDPPRPTDTPRPTRTPRATRAPQAAEPTATFDFEQRPAATDPAPTVAPAVGEPAAAPAGPVAPVGDDCPPEAMIKGNQGDEWIYHVPGGRSYSRTSPEQCFATEADARNAGYRAAQN